MICRAANKAKELANRRNNLAFASDRYTAKKFNGWKRKAMIDAKQSLESAPFKKFEESLHFSDKLEFLEKDNNMVTVFPVGNPSSKYAVTFDKTDKCVCDDAHDFGYQCKHEIAYEKKFDLTKFHHRWYQERVFEKGFSVNHLLLPAPVKSVFKDNNNDDDPMIVYDHDGNGNDDEYSSCGVDPLQSRKTRWSALQRKSEEICRLAVGSKEDTAAILTNMDMMLQKMRLHEPLNMCFLTTASTSNLAGELNYNGMDRRYSLTIVDEPRPVLGLQNIAPNSRSQKRLRCHRERFGRDKRQVRNSTIPKTSNLPPMAVTGIALKTKFHSCSFCGLPGHTVGMKCQAVTRWGGKLLVKDPTVQYIFCKCLQKTNYDFVLDPLPIEFLNQKIVTISNRKSKVIVLHGQYLIQHNNVVIECTLLMDKGEPCNTYRKQFFHIEDVCQLIHASVS